MLFVTQDDSTSFMRDTFDISHIIDQVIYSSLKTFLAQRRSRCILLCWYWAQTRRYCPHSFLLQKHKTWFQIRQHRCRPGPQWISDGDMKHRGSGLTSCVVVRCFHGTKHITVNRLFVGMSKLYAWRKPDSYVSLWCLASFLLPRRPLGCFIRPWRWWSQHRCSEGTGSLSPSVTAHYGLYSLISHKFEWNWTR